jgi:hypothetical protein
VGIGSLIEYLLPGDFTGPAPAPADQGAGPYPFLNAVDLVRPPGPRDPTGAVLMRYPGIGPQYNPIAIAQYALGAYDIYLENGHQALKRDFEAQLNWIVRAARRGPGGGLYWYHDFDNPHYPLRAPWPSAMAQGQVISVLVRAARLWPERSGALLDMASAALPAFRVPVAEGGVRVGPLEDPWYEEYPTPSPSRVLNGFVFALWGLGDAAAHDPEAARLLEDGLGSLARHAADYDLGFWTRYATGLLENRPASPFYHRVHVAQMRIMAACAGHGAYEAAAGDRELYADLARRWNRYWRDPISRTRALAGIAAAKRSARRKPSASQTKSADVGRDFEAK